MERRIGWGWVDEFVGYLGGGGEEVGWWASELMVK